MRYFIKVGLLFLIITSCKGQTNLAKDESQKAGVGKEKAESGIQNAEMKTGTDNSTVYLPLLKDKKVGIVTNQTGIIKYQAIDVKYVQDPRSKRRSLYAAAFSVPTL